MTEALHAPYAKSGLVELADHDRPQAHRHPLRRTAFASSWWAARGADDAHAADRAQQHVPGARTRSTRMFTMHGTTMIFLFVMPMNAAFFNYIVPLQIGARDVAFPRLNALQLLGVPGRRRCLQRELRASGALPDGRLVRLRQPHRAAVLRRPGHGLLGAGRAGAGLASLVASSTSSSTIINMRAPGMTPMRMPLFIWMTLVTNFLLLLALPVITIALCS